MERGEGNAPAANGTGAQARSWGWQRSPALPAPPRVADGAIVCTPVDGADDSSHAKPQRSRPNDEGMQQHAHLARLGGGWALPLTLLAQRTGSATAEAGRIDHTQAPIGFSAPLVDAQGLAGRTAERAIWLGNKVSPREAAMFPGQGLCDWAIPLHGSRGEGLLLFCGEVCRSKVGRAHRLRMQLMAKLQAQGPDPLADTSPPFL